jgi:hypothetical protein
MDATAGKELEEAQAQIEEAEAQLRSVEASVVAQNALGEESPQLADSAPRPNVDSSGEESDSAVGGSAEEASVDRTEAPDSACAAAVASIATDTIDQDTLVMPGALAFAEDAAPEPERQALRELQPHALKTPQPRRGRQTSGCSVAKGRTGPSTTSVDLCPSRFGHTLKPAQQGLRVAVVGDGWGGKDAGYEAIVTEADDYTFTVIATTGDHQWAESHVLKEHCIFLSEGMITGATKRQRKC